MIDNLEDAITHAREVAENWKSELVNCVSEEGRNTCLDRATEHELLAGWLTELQERREADRWIPVSERLPEEKKDTNTNDFAEVLCTTIFGGVRLYKYGTRIGDKQAHFWYGFGIFDSEITAWKYKPEPYESEAENE